MKSFASRCLSLLTVALLLAACQGAPQMASLPAGELARLEQSLAAGQLDEAESQLERLQQRGRGDSRLQQYQRRLAEAYLRQGQQALQAGDLDRAAQALGQARRLMPQAPALTTGLEEAITKTRQEQDRQTTEPLQAPSGQD